MSRTSKKSCCGKCDKAKAGTCSRLDHVLAALTAPGKGSS